MVAEELIKKYLIAGKLMQVATVDGGKPWVCTVYFVSDELQNLYWLSFPERRHSKDITKSPHVAIAIAVKHDQPVIGIQAEGTADEVDDEKTVEKIMEKYVAKYGAGKDFYKNFKAGKMKHRLYKFIPNTFVLFDEVHFKNDARQTWNPGV